MSGIILYIGIGLIILALLDWFPPTSLLVSPLVSELFKGGVLLVNVVWRYTIVGAKVLITDHITVISHLLHKRIDIDPYEKMATENERKR